MRITTTFISRLFSFSGSEGLGLQEKKLREKIWDFYSQKYKLILLIPFAILLLSLFFLIGKTTATGDIINKGVSLKGGVTVTIPLDASLSAKQMESSLRSSFPTQDILVRDFGVAGLQQGLIVEADIDINDDVLVTSFLDQLSESLGTPLDQLDFGVEYFGSSLGESFFKESGMVLALAFFFMALVVLIYFRSFVPSIAIVLAAFSDMVVALAFVNLIDLKLGTAGIAAFLMLIGYSVDTNILLSVRVLKRREGTLDERILSSIKTGTTQTTTSMIAILIAMLLTQSEVIKQIMLIMFVGLAADLLFTWVQNVGILRWYFERREKKHAQG